MGICGELLRYLEWTEYTAKNSNQYPSIWVVPGESQTDKTVDRTSKFLPEGIIFSVCQILNFIRGKCGRNQTFHPLESD
jgi:hypothetical protein